MVIKWKNFKEIFIRRKGLGILGSSDILGTAITSIFWFYMASVIQPEKYGEIFYLISIVAIAFNLSNIGTQNNMVVLTAKGKNLESTFNFISLIFGTISSLVLIIIFYQIDIIILLFGYIINSLSLGYLVGKQFYSQYAKYLLLQKILTVGLGLSFFYLFGADGIISALGISYIGFIIIIVKLHKTSSLNFPSFKNNFNFIWQNYSLKFIGALRENTDKLIIVPLLGFSFLGNYALSMQFIALISMPNAFFYKYMLTNDSRKIKNKTLKKYYLLGVTGLSITCSIFLPVIIPYVFPNFTEIGILQIMSFVLIPNAIVSIKFSEFLGDEKSKPVLFSALIGLITVIIGVTVLGSIFGAYGVATTYVLTTSFMAIFLIIWAKKQQIS
tara:strand:+ start:13734 stop:14888 length:1155 start_codon:yes stop_codon:yes gene_type:complete